MTEEQRINNLSFQLLFIEYLKEVEQLQIEDQETKQVTSKDYSENLQGWIYVLAPLWKKMKETYKKSFLNTDNKALSIFVGGLELYIKNDNMLEVTVYFIKNRFGGL